VLESFGYGLFLDSLRGEFIHRAGNIMTLSTDAHVLFHKLALWFDEIHGRVSWLLIRVIALNLPINLSPTLTVYASRMTALRKHTTSKMRLHSIVMRRRISPYQIQDYLSFMLRAAKLHNCQVPLIILKIFLMRWRSSLSSPKMFSLLHRLTTLIIVLHLLLYECMYPQARNALFTRKASRPSMARPAHRRNV
jgi:hypothetical protein